MLVGRCRPRFELGVAAHLQSVAARSVGGLADLLRRLEDLDPSSVQSSAIALRRRSASGSFQSAM